MFVLGAELTHVFERYGWYQGRTGYTPERLPRNLELFPLASAILDQFGGLTIGDCFEYDCVITFDHIENVSFLELIQARNPNIGRLFPIGLFDLANVPIVVNDRGNLFLNDDDDETLTLISEDVNRGFEILLRIDLFRERFRFDKL